MNTHISPDCNTCPDREICSVRFLKVMQIRNKGAGVCEHTQIGSLHRMQKKIVLFVMSILPFFVLKNYLVVSFYIFLFNVRHTMRNESDLDLEKLKHLLKITCTKGTVLFPYVTVNWIWDNSILDEYLILSNGEKIRMYDILKDPEKSHAHLARLVDWFLMRIPNVYQKRVFGLSHMKDARDIRYTFGRTLLLT